MSPDSHIEPALNADYVREFWACLDADGAEFLCPYCGAVVLDVSLHAAWHDGSPDGPSNLERMA